MVGPAITVAGGDPVDADARPETGGEFANQMVHRRFAGVRLTSWSGNGADQEDFLTKLLLASRPKDLLNEWFHLFQVRQLRVTKFAILPEAACLVVPTHGILRVKNGRGERTVDHCPHFLE